MGCNACALHNNAFQTNIMPRSGQVEPFGLLKLKDKIKMPEDAQTIGNEQQAEMKMHMVVRPSLAGTEIGRDDRIGARPESLMVVGFMSSHFALPASSNSCARDT